MDVINLSSNEKAKDKDFTLAFVGEYMSKFYLWIPN